MDETKVTPDAEEIASNVEVAPEPELPEFNPQGEPSNPNKETVPLSVFLALKEDMKDLKREIKESNSAKKNVVEVAGIADLANKYPDVSQEFIADMLSSATNKAIKEVESKYSPIIEKQKFQEEQQKFNTAFDNVYEKAIKDNPDLPSTIDKELIKTLVLTPKYKNMKIADILTTIYPPSNAGKQSSENETVTATGDTESISDFGKITSEQKTAIMGDAKARAKYFAWLDTQI